MAKRLFGTAPHCALADPLDRLFSIACLAMSTAARRSSPALPEEFTFHRPTSKEE
jgi:hypothetical protein